MSGQRLRFIRAKLKKRLAVAKAQAREQGDDVTPALIKARLRPLRRAPRPAAPSRSCARTGGRRRTGSAALAERAARRGAAQAREALRYSAGTRVDVIAKGARFGKLAEYRETNKRALRAKGRRKRGPDGLMNRPS